MNLFQKIFKKQKNQRHFIVFIIAATMATMFACAPSPDTNGDIHSTFDEDTMNPILGGKAVSNKDSISKMTVAIYDPDTTALCTGSILSSNVVLTAAHCVGDKDNHLVVIFDTQIKHQKEVRRVIEVMVNPKWKRHSEENKNTGDLALLRLEDQIPPSYKVAELLPASITLSDNDSVTLAGYGITNPTKGTGSGILRKTRTKIKDVKFSQSEVEIDQTTHHGACHGDSGGPAFFTHARHLYLWGVTSRGSSSEGVDCQLNSIYTKISAYKEWIQNTVRRWKP